MSRLHALTLGLTLFAAGTPGAAQPPLEGASLLGNGSFEEHGSVRSNRAAIFDAIPAWFAPDGVVQIHDGNSAGIAAHDGDSKLGLDAGVNTTLLQDVDLEPGRRYRLQLFYAPERNSSQTDSNDLDIEWQSLPLARLGGDRRYWRRHVFDLVADDIAGRLLLRGAGDVDGRGALVDSVDLVPVPWASENLVENGSFEEPYGLAGDSHRHFARIPGWDAAAGEPERRRHGHSGVDPYEGETVLQLDGEHQDTAVQVLDLVPGQRYDLEIGFSPRRSSGGDAVEVWGNDTLLTVLDGDRKQWHRRRVIVTPETTPWLLTLRAPRRSPGHPGRDDDDDEDGDHDRGPHGADAHAHRGSAEDDHRSRDHEEDRRADDGHRDDDDDDEDDDDDDDDHGGSRNHGGLVDDVRLYAACWAGDNLVANHSFEQHPPLVHGEQGSFLTVPGWRAAAGSVAIHRYGAKARSLAAVEGRDHLSLAGAVPVAVVQDLATEPGAPYLLEFAYSPQLEQSGTDRNDLEIAWGGETVAALSGDRRGWRHYRLPLRASGALTELRFAGGNARDGAGPQVDEVRVLRLADIAIAPAPLPQARDGEPFQYTVSLAEAGGVGLVFELLEAPDGMSIDAVTGTIAWPAPVAGTHPIAVRVADACGRVEEQSFELTVTGSNSPPEIVSTPITVTPLLHLRPRIAVSDDNLASESVRLNGAPFTSESAVSADGVYTLEVEATDAAGNTATRVLQFTIDRNASP